MSSRLLKHVAAVRVSNVDKKSVDGDASVRLCNYTDVYYRDTIEATQDFMAATATRDQVAAFGLQPGDVIITKDSETADDIGVPAYVHSSAPDLVCGYHLAVIRPDAHQVHARFLYWLMASISVRGQLSAAATGVTRFGLRRDAIRSVELDLWPVQRQRAIADYLDTETARLDALIHAKQRLQETIELKLRVQARRLTAEAEVVPLRRLVASVRTGTTPPADVIYDLSQEPAVEWIAPGDVDRRMGVKHAQRGLNGRALLERYCPTFPASSTLIIGIGATAGRVGHLDRVATGNQQVTCIVAAPTMLPRYLSWVLWSRSEQMRATAPFTTLPILTNEFVRALSVPCPSRRVQEDVTNRLDVLAAASAAVMSAEARQIALLHERRQALVTAAVKGEIAITGRA